MEPLVWNKRSGNLVGGHQRLKILKEMGFKEVEVSVVDLTDAKEKALNLALNKISGEWDYPLLKDILEEINTGDFDIEITGFDEKEIEDLMTQYHEPTDGLTDDDAIPEQVPTICKKGDTWKLGEHRLLCGDATVITDVERLMGGEKALLMVTDPPYGVEIDQSWRDEALGDKAMGPGNTNKVQNDNRSDWSDAWTLAPVQIAYVWHASKFQDIVMASLRNADFDIIQQIIWNKSIMVMGRCDYHFKHEPCLYCVKRGFNHNWIGDRAQTTIWDAPSPNHIMSGSTEVKTEHPTQKPAILWEIPIKNHLPINGILYEPFSGSGTAIIACEKLSRKCYGIDIDPHYVDIAIKRWEDFTGKKAELCPQTDLRGDDADRDL